jgi:transcriptional regulator with XRE-family HTH domain
VVRYRTLEENISEPDLEVLVKLANFYGIGLDDLLQRPANEPDLKHILETRPLYDGQRLSVQDVRILEETAGKLARQTKKLEELTRLIEEEPELVRRLQELKILGARLITRSL